jgi:subtilisin family serine protease
MVSALLILALDVSAQVNRYMVFFKDKNNSPYSTTNPSLFLSQRSIDRRIKQGITIVEQDLPVNETYVQTLRDAGADVFFRTRWMNGVLVQCDAGLISTLQALPAVDHIDRVAPGAKLLNSGRKRSISKVTATAEASATQSQLALHGLDDMQQAGYKGEDRWIAIFDAGFPGVNASTPFQHVFADNHVRATKDFVYNSGDVYQYNGHGTEVLSVIAAFQDGVYTGGAFEANYLLYVTEDVSSEYRIEEYNWLFAAEQADSAGVDIVNSSLGYYDFDDNSMDYPKSALDGNTTVVTRAAQWCADRGMIIVCSTGNEGNVAWQTITAPADARDVLAVGNVTTSGVRVPSSSIGPSADGRIKPDVSAMGYQTSVIEPSGALGTDTGTSLSAPLVTSLAAGVWQRYPDLTNVEIMEAIRKSASQASAPNNSLGYGIPDFVAVVNYLDQVEQENPFDVFPNPILADSLTIRPFDPAQVSSCELEWISAQGQVLMKTNVAFTWLNRTYVMTTQGQASGIYFLRVTWGVKRYVFKIVKK